MASSTTNLDLTLPVGGENVSRQIINANNVKIDEAVGAVPSGTDLQSQVNALNNNLTNKNTFMPIQIGSLGTYADDTLYTALKNNNSIVPNRMCLYRASFTGGARFGLCLLYEDTKEYGFILAFHYASAPRYLRVDGGTVYVTSWAS